MLADARAVSSNRPKKPEGSAARDELPFFAPISHERAAVPSVAVRRIDRAALKDASASASLKVDRAVPEDVPRCTMRRTLLALLSLLGACGTSSSVGGMRARAAEIGGQRRPIRRIQRPAVTAICDAARLERFAAR
jgi:hypothetical protein